jgi:hypothetical protein
MREFLARPLVLERGEEEYRSESITGRIEEFVLGWQVGFVWIDAKQVSSPSF